MLCGPFPSVFVEVMRTKSVYSKYTDFSALVVSKTHLSTHADKP